MKTLFTTILLSQVVLMPGFATASDLCVPTETIAHDGTVSFRQRLEALKLAGAVTQVKRVGKAQHIYILFPMRDGLAESCLLMIYPSIN